MMKSARGSLQPPCGLYFGIDTAELSQAKMNLGCKRRSVGIYSGQQRARHGFKETMVSWKFSRERSLPL